MESKEFKKLLKFNGNNSEYIGLRIINNILTVLTLGLYYPWSKAANSKYLYSETEFMETRFVFHGTGKEMFKGFLKAIGIFIGLYVILIVFFLLKLPILGVLIYFISIFLMIPLIIHSSNKYRLSRTSWRGIHFGYRGILKEFMKLYFVNILLTAITAGIYSSWMQVNISSFIRGNSRFGNIEFKFIGKGLDLFLLKLKGIFLMVITLGIYSFWYFKNLIAFEIDNTKMIQNGKEINLRSTMTGGQIFGLFITNYLIIIFTLGIGTGIAINRSLRIVMQNIEFDSEIDAESLIQTEEEYKNATGDDLAGVFDISIF